MAKSSSLISSQPNDGWYYHNPRGEILPFVPNRAKRFLDIGCGAGAFGASLKKERDAEVWGIEIDPEAALLAKECLDNVFSGDFEGIRRELPKSYFDCITMNDVLEHMSDPFQVLADVKELLIPGGSIVCSLPNLRYFPVLKQIVAGKDFQYADWGVMDRTHLRFFTQKSIVRMMTEQGYEVNTIHGINGRKSIRFELLNALFFNALSDARHQQIVCVAKPRQPVSDRQRM